MASVLYKRYVPPKRASGLTPTTTAVPANERADSSNGSKRKREDGNGDINVQTGKKSKNTREALQDSQRKNLEDLDATIPKWHQEPLDERDLTSSPSEVMKGDFSHIKSAKKRHKLEKEARKQRRAAEKLQAEDTSVKDDQRTTILQQEEDDAEEQTVEHTPKRNEVSETNELHSDDNDHLRKHTNVMSKFQKAVQQPRNEGHTSDKEDEPRPKPELRDLAPLPQPEPIALAPFKPDPSSLPAWLARPERVSSKPSSKGFDSLSLEPKLVRHLNALTFLNPLPVQEAIIPLLMPPTMAGKSKRNPASKFLPGSEPVLPDLAISAPTGSGKTLAYLLPIIESLKQSSPFRKLRAMVVVPTRELVQQVRAVAEALAKGSTVQIGVAANDGKTKFTDEQSKLIAKGKYWDQQEYNKLMDRQHLRNYPPNELHNADDLEALLPLSPMDEQRMKDVMGLPSGFVASYTPTIDLLIATPGRLLEHINNTLGFSLDNLDYLILDEADKLLEQQYDGFLERVNILLPSGSCTKRGCRKVMLSATMTRDVSKLSALKLRWPRLIVVGDEEERILSGNAEEVEPDLEGRFSLPPTLQEFCVPISDASEKPLILLKLLESHILNAKSSSSPLVDKDADLSGGNETSSFVNSSNSDDTSSLSSSSSISSDSSDSSADDEDSSSDQESVSSTSTESSAASASHQSLQEAFPLSPAATLLIFTSTTTSAARLSHLLRALRPSFAPSIIPLTKTQRLPSQAVSYGSPIIAITTDRTSRGLDTILRRPVTHVIQYDVPRSLRDYVHRAGRSARAGRSGETWSFYESHQARWFVKEVLKSEKVRRKDEVEKVKVAVGESEDASEERRRFVDAVEAMRGLVFGKGGE